MSEQTDKIKELITEMWLTLHSYKVTIKEYEELAEELDKFKENVFIASFDYR